MLLKSLVKYNYFTLILQSWLAESSMCPDFGKNRIALTPLA